MESVAAGSMVSREELNGLGYRLNTVERELAAQEEAITTSKQDRRDLWAAIGGLRGEDARIERLVNAISVKVAGIVAGAAIFQSAAVAIIVKWLTH